ncbi:prenyltransferase alpha subunit, putative [Trichomonas vaginalis G3]|uniref:Protein farnesyltransferase/geranylgeranyltransferase type-1 subunit alpha n=1 Tax=Trichomonas vaginalis (strain ATCC PRA-98 / G3) TaxID=412133 RepID=A2DSI9_TRIV3|nr:CAAX-protein geranylgeranyltransferase protein [Trichomonas vaginalis G3]EAY16569.1 prenyltransferase alpha subunit, putative [Trichomonas vaginalis G3]KAI5532938.1 CAAX-protein geranylgeranyltransferase protein [Trichomonas vaginalis G3]|eukprot:XP_001328792.1 prenyltransferase alpha subunit [Trichomonas vaginalis G3]
MTENTLYKDREDWKDIEPLPLPQQPGDPFQVEYTEDYVDLMGYFLAVLHKKEVSQRALEITNKVIQRFHSHYTAWWYKYYILEKIGYDFKTELQNLEKIIKDAPKSYQAWHYRQWLLERTNEKVDEVSFLKEVFLIDAKNFHAWSYAIWFADHFKLYKEIYDLANYQIEIDMRNNSAWNTRKAMVDFMNLDPKAEFEAAEQSLLKITKNEASMNYAFAIVEKDKSLEPKLQALGEKLYQKNPKNPRALQILLYVASGANDTEKIQKLCQELIIADPIRKPYYSLVLEGKIKYR